MRNGGESTRWRSRGIVMLARAQAPAQPVEVGLAVEDADRDDRRPQDRVLLDVPHQRVGVAHVVREAIGCGHPAATLLARDVDDRALHHVEGLAGEEVAAGPLEVDAVGGPHLDELARRRSAGTACSCRSGPGTA